ncbi:tripartite tricarboxylate transporter TctB family protein [Geodermatophilus poikilotrophus]|uniref:Tripartite tricarboxylate transporter TctB family protein n=1 Tax=Geodermatophilus poikilotrophus TaxID=1333667 RepID=A0A1H9ZAP0_9ACTN|nr:tripartite tricarboxylate transporter TctB family protein [Geodermatophilus poikilotrophus]SES78538.1 Tripartite tricarboxylate transporter TctB family protein [Geodermatophilus poikilotrophus]
MTSPAGGTHVPGRPGGHPAAGATPQAGPGTPPEVSTPEEFDLEEAIHQVEAEEHEGRPPAAGLLGNLVVAAAVVVLGVAAVVGSLAFDAGSARSPEAGTWPLMVSVVIVVLGLGLVVTARRTTDAERFGRTSWLVLVGLATMVVFVAVIPVIGFEIPAALLAFVWLRFLGSEGWRTSIVTSVALVVAFYLIFVGALSVPIPHLF